MRKTNITATLLALLVAGSSHVYANQTAQGEDEEQLGVSDFEQVIRDKCNGITSNDYTDKKKFTIDQPTCAYINITGTEKMPSAKGKPKNVWMDVYTDGGDHFLKRAIIDAQGNSSLRFDKKNFKVDFCEDEWVGDETTSITIGDWVKQDSYHFKAYYIDYLRGVGAVGYKIYDQMAQTVGRPWTRAAANISKPKDNARCYPDGFPCIVYLNGKFYGIYAWQLKKHRDNMNQQKSVAEHIHLDGNMGDDSLWNTDSVQWGKFEVRNPKNLYTMDGKPYDGDNPGELIDETSEHYDVEGDDESVKENKRRSAQVKKYILALGGLCHQMQQMADDQTGTDDMRTFFEAHFDVKSLVDYSCFNHMVYNVDGYKKNWQWFTYDGVRWFVAPYDLDCTFGNIFTGDYVTAADRGYTARPVTGPFNWINQLYSQDIHKRYCELRDADIFDAANINSMLRNWYDAIGQDMYDCEWLRWPDSKCINDMKVGEGWKAVDDYYWRYDTYDEKTVYAPGDRCQLSELVWEATETVCGVKPYVSLGYRDSLERYEDWTTRRIALLDQYFGYERVSVDVASVQASRGVGQVYDMSGRKRSTLGRGLNIVRRADGSTAKVLVR